jgi:hypothetical protein
VTGRASTTLLPVLEEAVTAGVLTEAGEQLAFRHDLIRQAMYEAVPASVRKALHRQVAQSLADAGLPLGQIAAHLLAAAPDGLDSWALDRLAQHAKALASQAPELAAELLSSAMSRVEQEDPRSVRLLCGLAQALNALNRPADPRRAVGLLAPALGPGPRRRPVHQRRALG